MNFRHSDENQWVDDDFMVVESTLVESRFIPRTDLASKLGKSKSYKVGRNRALKTSPKFEKIRKSYFSQLSDALSRDASIKELKKIVEGAYFMAYAQGVLNSGVKTSRDIPGVMKKMSDSEIQAVSRDVAEEMQYLIKFDMSLDEAGRDDAVIESRVKQYVKSLNGIYGSGRVNGLKSNTFINWTPGPDSVEEDRCESCKYLIDNSPFLPENLPTTPRAGDTRCLFNCKDVLVVKEVTAQDEDSLRQSSLTYEEHRSKLDYLRQNRRAKA